MAQYRIVRVKFQVAVYASTEVTPEDGTWGKIDFWNGVNGLGVELQRLRSPATVVRVPWANVAFVEVGDVETAKGGRS